MTKDEAEKLKAAAELYGEAEYAAGMTRLGNIDKADTLWLALIALIDSATNDLYKKTE